MNPEIEALKKLVLQQQQVIENLMQRVEDKEVPVQIKDVVIDEDLLFGSERDAPYSVEEMQRIYSTPTAIKSERYSNGERYIKKYFAPLANSKTFLKYIPK